MAPTASTLASLPLAQSCPRVFTPATTPTLQTWMMISSHDRTSPELAASFCGQRVCIGAMFTLLTSLSVDIELVTTCSLPALPPLTIHTMPGPKMGVMSMECEIGGDVIIVGKSKPVVVVVLPMPVITVNVIHTMLEYTCSSPSKYCHPCSDDANAASTSSAIMLPFDSGCPELHPLGWRVPWQVERS